MTASESSAKCRKSKLARGYKRIPDLISPTAADDLSALMRFFGSGSSQTNAIEQALSIARKIHNPYK